MEGKEEDRKKGGRKRRRNRKGKQKGKARWKEEGKKELMSLKGQIFFFYYCLKQIEHKRRWKGKEENKE